MTVEKNREMSSCVSDAVCYCYSDQLVLLYLAYTK